LIKSGYKPKAKIHALMDGTCRAHTGQNKRIHS
jgi:hypothetical protein